MGFFTAIAIVSSTVIAQSAPAVRTQPAKPRGPSTSITPHMVSLLDVAWPVERTYRRLYPDRIAVLEPEFDRLPDTRWDQVITFSGGKVEALEARSGKTVWPRPVVCRAQPTLLGSISEQLIFATRHRLFAVERFSGRRIWQFGNEPAHDSGSDPESIPSWTDHALTAKRLLGIDDRGVLVCVDPVGGSLRWRRDVGVQLAGTLVADDRHVCAAAWRDGRAVVTVLDAATGRTLHAVRLDTDQPVTTAMFAGDKTLLAVTSGVIFVIDTATGEATHCIRASGRFVMSTLHTDCDALFVSEDGRHITKYAARTGERLWTTPRIGTDTRAGLWSAQSAGTLYAASADALMAFDATDGPLRWRVAKPPGLAVQSPRLTREAIITVEADLSDNDRSARGTAGGLATQPAPDGRRYVIRRFDCETGRENAETGALVTEPLASFGGVFVLHNSLIVLDGNRLIGYVGRPEP